MNLNSQKEHRNNRKTAVTRIGVLAGGLVLLFLLSFGLGRYAVPIPEVVRILWNQLMVGCERFFSYLHINAELSLAKSWTDNMEIAVLNVRLPRILLACLVGCALSSAGVAYQGVFRNPMAAPDILGASSGACFGAALAILLGFSRVETTALAFASSLLTVALVYLIGSRTKGTQMMNILLTGVMISSLFSAGTSYLKLVADPSSELPEITYWLMGSLSGARLSDVRFAGIFLLLGLLPLFLLRWKMNLLTLDEEEAQTMGVNTGRLRFVIILCATVLTATSVSVSGMIGWVGLVIPHLSRKLVGNDYRYLFPAAMIFGAVFLLLVDNCSRNLIATEIPIGILTAFVGAPFFIYLMTRKERLL